MSTLDSQIDASFFNLVHQLIQCDQSSGNAERRSNGRRAFFCAQRIAAVSNENIPADSEFIDVQCHDINGTGFSFFLAERPQFDALVAALGNPPNVIYLLAHVQHCCDVLVYPSGLFERIDDRRDRLVTSPAVGDDTTPMVLVGCQFVKRLSQ